MSTKLSQSFEIRMVEARLGYAVYPRPCIVTKIETNRTARVFFLSTKNYSERGQSFCISNQHPDFSATGLKATSHTIHPAQHIELKYLGSKRGELTGQLAREFEAWLG